MTNIWVIADTHFGHRNILTFKRNDGTPLRPFTSIEGHDEAMVENWNRVVRPQDHVYHLGDVVINRRSLEIVKRLNGHKRLVRGNHDIFKTKEFIEVGFEEIYGVRVFPKNNFILSHIPLHPECLASRAWVNVHGHLHANKLEDEGRYRCVSVEHIDYTPTLLME